MNWTTLHAAMNELPFFLAGLGSVLLLFSIVAGGTNVRRAALIILVAAALVAAATYLTGRSAEKWIRGAPGVTDENIRQHHDASQTSFAVTLLLGFVAIDGLVMLKRAVPWSKMFMVLALLTAVGATAASAWAVVAGSALHETTLEKQFLPHNRSGRPEHPKPLHEPTPRKNAVPLSDGIIRGFETEMGLVVPFELHATKGPASLRVNRAVAPSTPGQAYGALAVFEIEVTRGDRVRTVHLLGEPPWSVSVLTSLFSWTYSLPEDIDAADLSITFLLRPRAVWTARDLLKETVRPSSAATSPPLPLSLFDPGFPVNERGEGCVILELRIDAEGNVIGSRTLIDEPGYSHFVEESVKKWEFSPARANGKAVEGLAVVAISFVEPY
jgi:hypothetical protein